MYIYIYRYIDIDIYPRANPWASRDSYRVSNLCSFLICADALTNLLRPSKKTQLSDCEAPHPDTRREGFRN